MHSEWKKSSYCLSVMTSMYKNNWQRMQWSSSNLLSDWTLGAFCILWRLQFLVRMIPYNQHQ